MEDIHHNYFPATFTNNILVDEVGDNRISG